MANDEESQKSETDGASSYGGESARDKSEIGDGESKAGSDDDSEDEISDEDFEKHRSSRLMGQSSRRMSMGGRSDRLSIKSMSRSNYEHVLKQALAMNNKVDFVESGQNEEHKPKSFYEIAKEMKKKAVEDRTLSRLRKEKKRLRTIDTLNGIFTLSTIVIYMIEFEIYISDVDKEKFVSNVMNHTLRFIMISMSACSCIAQYYHYHSLLSVDKVLKIKSERDTIWTSGYTKYMVLQMAFSVTICPPFVDSYIDIEQLKGKLRLTFDTMGMFFVLLRFYNLVGVVDQYSKWSNEKATKICNMFNFSPDISFLIKCELTHRPYIAIFSVLMITTVLFGLGVRTFEVCYIPTLPDGGVTYYNSFINTFWFVIVTMFTVGYGDGFPRTHIGRFVVLWVGVVGTLISSLMVAALTSSSGLTKGETRVFNKVELLGMKGDAQKIGAELIYNIFLINKLNKKIQKYDINQEEDQEIIAAESMNKFGILSRCRLLTMNFNLMYNRFKTSTSTPEDLILNTHEKNEAKFRQIYNRLGCIKDIVANCKSIESKQKDMIGLLTDTINDYKEFANFLVQVNYNYTNGS